MALERRGVRCILDWTAKPVGHVRATGIFDREYVEGDARVYFTQPHAWDRRTKEPLFGFTMYESDALPDAWLKRMPNVDELWVPSSWNQEIFTAATGRPVHLIPLGVNAQDFPVRPRVRGEKLRILTFSTQAAETRKGTDIAVYAFKAAFPRKRKDVELVIKSTWDCTLALDDPRTSSICGPVDTLQLAAFYAGFDALLYPSRAEGFGLIGLEFMCTGAPAIFADATGMHDYAEFGLTVGSTKAPATVGHGRGGDDLAAPYGNWFEPNFDDLVDRLHEVDRQYQDVQDLAIANAARIAEEWSWERTADRIVERLEYRLGR
jgi:glycosyltransferase involved in cell wall biosynthesis